MKNKRAFVISLAISMVLVLALFIAISVHAALPLPNVDLRVYQMVDSLSGQVYVYDIPSHDYQSTQVLLPVYSLLTADAVTASSALVDVPGMQGILAANAIYQIEVCASIESTTNKGTEYGLKFSTSGATIDGQVAGTLTDTTTKTERITAFDTPTSEFATKSGQGGVKIFAVVTTTNAGILTFQQLKVQSGTATVFKNSYISVQKIG